MGLNNNDIVQVTWRGLCFGQRIVLVNNYFCVGAFNPGNSVATDLSNILNAIAPAGANDKTTEYLAALPPQYTLTDIRAQRILPTRSAYVPLAFVGTVGTNANAATVANDAAALNMRTAFSGRKYYSVKHIGPVPDAASAAGLLTNAYKTILSALGTKLMEDIVVVGETAFLRPGVLNPPTGVVVGFTNFLIGDQSRTQRRRTVGIGE